MWKYGLRHTRKGKLLFKLFNLASIANAMTGLVGLVAPGPVKERSTPGANNHHGIIFWVFR